MYPLAHHSTNTNPPYHSISSIRDPSCSITKGEGISNAPMPAYMTSNNIVPTSQVQIENGFYDFQSLLEDKLLSNSDVRSGYRQVSYGLYESQPDIFVMRPGMGGIIPSGSVRPPSIYAVSQSGNEFNFIDLVNYEPVALAQSDNLLNYIRGGNHPEIIPGRLDLLLPTRGENPEAAYSLVNAEPGSGRYFTGGIIT